jgi:hypothetical protein
MRNIDRMFEEAKATRSDINEHLDVLYAYGLLSSTICEFGCRWGMSTTAFLKAAPKKLVSYDLEIYPRMETLAQVARDELPQTDFQLKNANILFEDIEPVDLLFLDSYHVYDQVLLELVYHGKKANKFMILHDTETYKTEGQTKGYRGIWPAIEGFLRYNPEWVMIEQYKHNNGLTILAKNQRSVRFWRI